MSKSKKNIYSFLGDLPTYSINMEEEREFERILKDVKSRKFSPVLIYGIILILMIGLIYIAFTLHIIPVELLLILALLTIPEAYFLSQYKKYKKLNLQDLQYTLGIVDKEWDKKVFGRGGLGSNSEHNYNHYISLHFENGQKIDKVRYDADSHFKTDDKIIVMYYNNEILGVAHLIDRWK